MVHLGPSRCGLAEHRHRDRRAGAVGSARRDTIDWRDVPADVGGVSGCVGYRLAADEIGHPAFGALDIAGRIGGAEAALGLQVRDRDAENAGLRRHDRLEGEIDWGACDAGLIGRAARIVCRVRRQGARAGPDRGPTVPPA